MKMFVLSYSLFIVMFMAGCTQTVNEPLVYDDTATVQKNNSVEIDIFDNDSDSLTETDMDSLLITSPPTHGTVKLSNGFVTYTPDKNYVGSDSFVYSVTDIDGVEHEATVDITVTDINSGSVDGVMLVLSPGTIEKVHTVGSSPCPQNVGVLTAKNTSNQDAICSLKSNHKAIKGSCSEIAAGSAVDITLQFNCSSTTGFPATVTVELTGKTDSSKSTANAVVDMTFR